MIMHRDIQFKYSKSWSINHRLFFDHVLTAKEQKSVEEQVQSQVCKGASEIVGLDASVSIDFYLLKSPTPASRMIAVITGQSMGMIGTASIQVTLAD